MSEATDEARWSDLKEIGQGGPETGILSFGDWTVPGRYNPPVLATQNHFLASRWIGGGFRVYSIDPVLRSTVPLDLSAPFIGMVSVNGDKLSYRPVAYTDDTRQHKLARYKTIFGKFLDMIS